MKVQIAILSHHYFITIISCINIFCYEMLYGQKKQKKEQEQEHSLRFFNAEFLTIPLSMRFLYIHINYHILNRHPSTYFETLDIHLLPSFS